MSILSRLWNAVIFGPADTSFEDGALGGVLLKFISRIVKCKLFNFFVPLQILLLNMVHVFYLCYGVCVYVCDVFISSVASGEVIRRLLCFCESVCLCVCVCVCAR